MSNAFTVVICAAGTGERLGFNVPKSLVKILDKPFIQWQLEMLQDINDLIVVVGFKGREVADLVWSLRPDAVIAINHSYRQTGTAESLRIAASASANEILVLDGDVLISKKTFEEFSKANSPLLGIMPLHSKDSHPVYVKDDLLLEFDTTRITNFEWTGPLKIDKETALNIGSRHIYMGLNRFLPMPCMIVDGVELDYFEDMDLVTDWVMKNYER